MAKDTVPEESRPGESPLIELRAVDRDNFEVVIALEVADEQRDFLNSNVESVAWAYVASESHPFVVYEGDTPVGLATFGYIPADGRCWISHFMIDSRCQGRGIGRPALEQLLERMTAASGGANLLVAVNPNNAAAIKLYESFGFVDTGRVQNDEMVMRRAGAQSA